MSFGFQSRDDKPPLRPPPVDQLLGGEARPRRQIREVAFRGARPEAVAGDVAVTMMTQGRGSSNAKAKRELGWQPIWPSWQGGSRRGLDTPIPLPARSRTPAGDTSAA